MLSETTRTTIPAGLHLRPSTLIELAEPDKIVHRGRGWYVTSATGAAKGGRHSSQAKAQDYEQIILETRIKALDWLIDRLLAIIRRTAPRGVRTVLKPLNDADAREMADHLVAKHFPEGAS